LKHKLCKAKPAGVNPAGCALLSHRLCRSREQTFFHQRDAQAAA
jgi:hypothetical protein